MTRTIDNRINIISERISSASQGDLYSEVRVNGSDDLGKLESGLGDLLKEFLSLVVKSRDAAGDMLSTSRNIATSSDQINSSVQQISSTVQQIAKGSQQQAKDIEDINRLVESLSKNTKSLASKAVSAAELSSAVGESSTDGSRSASAAAEKINRIIEVSEESASNTRVLAERCNKVSSVLIVIRKIAGKTNLLALNAAIEAARAGEAGKGFAVVADEVKGLAEGSAKSSEEIEEIIKKIQDDARVTASSIESGLREITEGKIVIHKALRALEEIAKKVVLVDNTVKTIAQSITEQVGAVELLGKRASDIAAFAEENAAATEECAAATEEESAGMQEITNSIHDLSNLGSQLESTLSKYKVNGGASEEISAKVQSDPSGVTEA